MLRIEGRVINRKRTYRIYREQGLQVCTKRRKKLVRTRVPMLVPNAPNERWSLDFVSDQLANGRRLCILNVIDDYSRECVLQTVDFSISGQRLARELDRLARALPNTIACDNGPEFTSKAMFFWARREAAIYPTSQAHSKRIHRKFQRQVSRLLSESELVRQFGRCAFNDRALKKRLQPRQTTPIAGEETACGVRKSGRLISSYSHIIRGSGLGVRSP